MSNNSHLGHMALDRLIAEHLFGLEPITVEEWLRRTDTGPEDMTESELAEIRIVTGDVRAVTHGRRGPVEYLHLVPDGETPLRDDDEGEFVPSRRISQGMLIAERLVENGWTVSLHGIGRSYGKQSLWAAGASMESIHLTSVGDAPARALAEVFSQLADRRIRLRP